MVQLLSCMDMECHACGHAGVGQFQVASFNTFIWISYNNYGIVICIAAEAVCFCTSVKMLGWLTSLLVTFVHSGIL